MRDAKTIIRRRNMRVSFPYVDRKYICDVLEEMRKCDNSKNYGPIKSLIEQAQIMAQAMEDALTLQKSIESIVETQKHARKLIKKYNKEVEKKKPDMKKVKEILDEMRGL
jgi:hypothetical protein